MGLAARQHWRLPPSERLRRERELTGLRLFVAAGVLVEQLLVSGARSSFLAGAAVVYLVAALIAFLAVRSSWRAADAIALAAEAADVGVGVALVHVGTGPASLLVLVLALIAAAHRGGHRRALIATGAAAALILAAAFVLPTPVGPPVSNLLTGALAQCAFVIVAGMAIAYFAESSDRLRLESETVAAVMSHADARLGLKHTMAVVFDTVVGRFNARRAVLLVRDASTNRVFMWQGATMGAKAADAIRVDSLDPRTFERYAVLPDAPAWSAVPRTGADGVFDVIALNSAGDLLPNTTESLPAPFLASVGPFEHLLGFAVERPGEWGARLFLIDPRIGRRGRRDAVELGHRMVRRLCPAVDSASLLHRLRSRSAADERTRIGRELHDGVIQSLLGIQIQLHTLGRELGEGSRPVAAELDRLGDLLRNEVRALREMMQRMSPPELPPERLVETLSDIVQRFQYETGIAARFSSHFDRIDLSPRACRELTRVVQEALVNVRKHSHAAKVFVQFTCADGVCRVSVVDDGRGFPVTGSRQVPHVLRERVHLLGGDVTVESAPNQGARIAISIPIPESYAFAG